MAEQTEYEKLQTAVAHDQRLRDQLNSIVHGDYGTDLDRHAALGDFARQVAADSLNKGAPPPFDPSRVVGSFTQQNISQQQGDDLTQQGKPQEGKGFFASTAEGFENQQYEQNIQRIATASDAIHSAQQQQLLQEYEQAFSIQNTPEHPDARESAIRRVLEKLDAQSLLKEQIALTKTYLEEQPDYMITNKEGKKVGRYDEALKIAEKRTAQEILDRRAAEERLSEQERTDLAKKRQEEESLRQAALTTTDKDQARKAFLGLLNKRHEETVRYDIFQEISDNDGDAYILGVIDAVSAALQKARQQKQNTEEQEQEEHVQEGLNKTRAQNAQSQNNITGVFNTLRHASHEKGGIRSLVRQGVSELKKQALKQAKKYLIEVLFLTPPYIGWWIVGILLIIILLIVLIIAIIALVVYITGQSSGGTGGTPQNVAALVSVAQEIETCERSRYGFHPPSPSCVVSLNLPSSFGSEVQGFVNAVNRGYASFQCGQYIWAAQKYVLNWIPFPGNVGTVYDWYWVRSNHTLQGYNWIPNPDNPALGNSSSPANILPGDIILYGSIGRSDPGHIAIVTTVQSDSFNFTVTEANYHHGAIDLRPTNLHDGLGRGAYILGWWRRQ